MAKKNNDFFDVHLLNRRIEHLEDVGRHTLEALDLAARLGNFQHNSTGFDTKTAILKETCQRISQLIKFHCMAVYLVDDLSLEFKKKYEHTPIGVVDLEVEFEHLVENKTIAWALQRKKPTPVPTKDNKNTLLIHSIATANKTKGLFIGLLDEDTKTIMDSSMAVLSIILLNSANTLENLQLLKLNTETNNALAKKVAQLSEQVASRKSAEVELKKTRNFLDKVINSIPDPLSVKDANQHFLMVNDAFCEAYGHTREFILGKKAKDLLPQEDAEALFKAGTIVLETGQDQVLEFSFAKHDEESHTYSIKTALLPQPDTGEKILVSVIRDVTEQEKITQTLRNAKEQAELASRAKTEFLANMSHEIRTPLNGVLGMLQLSTDTNLDEVQRDYIETALESGRSLLTVINDVLDLSKIEAGKFEIDKARFVPREIVKSVVQTFVHSANAAGVDLDFSIEDSVPEVAIGDGGRIRQILFNLVGNSVKFTEKGFVHTSLAALPQKQNDVARLLFTVEDSGIGIPDNQLDRIFEAFTQVDGSSRRKYGGTGLGLGIVRRLLNLMNGEIAVESEEGKGTTIYVRIDVGLPAVHSRRTRRRGGQKAALRSGSTVLLVEDNRVNQIMAQRLLEKLDFTVHWTSSGEEALKKLKTISADCILMDIQMPGMDGMETTQRIRNGEAGKKHMKTPIIALTAHAMQGDRERFMAVGMSAYIAKPFEMDALKKTLCRVLSKPDQK